MNTQKNDGCTQVDKITKEIEERPQDEDTGPFPIPSNKFTNPGIQDQLRTLYKTLEEFYVISHRVKNPE